MIKRLAIILLLATPLATATSAATTRNDDSCDIGLFPAATLLLPYFEVDFNAREGEGQTTIFTVTNTSPVPQAARVTLWTDFSYPVLSFNLFLTGYDVQKVSLTDVIKRGLIAPDVEMGSGSSPVGELSSENNPRLDEQSCAKLPGTLPAALITRLQNAFSIGRVPALGSAPACNTLGGVHVNAVGYATIDVVGACTDSLPIDENYFTHEIRFDNVLIGDYIQVDSGRNFAQGNPLVHIRAIPEGGQVSTRRKTNLPRTFYSRLQPSAATRTLDARQPLPSTFATRWIAGGSGGLQTYFKIWRESAGDAKTACSSYPMTGGAIGFPELVLFDEDENPETMMGTPLFPFESPVLPSTVLIELTNESVFPPNTSGVVAGWMYFNLQNLLQKGSATQNWVTTSMRAENRFSVDLDAISLGNGCTPPTAYSNAVITDPKAGALPIGPAPNTNP